MGLILLTGATGFIGGQVTAALLAAGHEVRALVRGSPDRAPANTSPFVADLTVDSSLDGIEAGVSTVVHCAGRLGGWAVGTAELEAVNVLGTERLLRRFVGREVRVLVLGAAGVTGPVQQGPADETYPCVPTTPYERSKHAAEVIVTRTARELGLDAAVLRPTFTYGPSDRHKLPLFRAIARGRYALLGSGDSLIHPVHVDDVVAGVLLALEHATTGRVYVIGGPRPVTQRELAETIADAVGARRPSWRIPVALARVAASLAEAAGRALGRDPLLTRSRVAMMSENFDYTIARARDELGFRPSVDLRTGIESTVRHYRAAGFL